VPPSPDTDPEARSKTPLPSRASGGQAIAGLFATLDHFLLNRPGPVAAIEDEYREPWASADGLTVEGLHRPMEEPGQRPEPEDRSGARL
jgi:hypothetical protein